MDQPLSITIKFHEIIIIFLNLLCQDFINSVPPNSIRWTKYAHRITTQAPSTLSPQILRTSYGPESCRSPKSSASATLYASSC